MDRWGWNLAMRANECAMVQGRFAKRRLRAVLFMSMCAGGLGIKEWWLCRWETSAGSDPGWHLFSTRGSGQRSSVGNRR